MHASLQHHVAQLHRTANRCRDHSLAEPDIRDFVHASRHIISTLQPLLLSQPSSAHTIIQEALTPLITILRYPLVFSSGFTSIRTHALLLFVRLYAYCNSCNDDAALDCLQTVSRHASSQDVHIILTAPLQIAIAQNRRTSFMHLLPIARRSDRFLAAFEAILRGFGSNSLLRQWSPLQCMHIVSALVLAVELKTSPRPRGASAFVSALQLVFSRVLAGQSDDEPLPSELFLAVAAAVLHADAALHSDKSAPRARCAPTTVSVQYVRQTVARIEQQLANFSEQPDLLCFESRNRSVIATVFVISTIPKFVTDCLSPAQIGFIRRSLELCMRTSLSQCEQNASKDFEFHQQVCKCIDEYPTTLASAYVQLIQRERACESSVHFLTNLAVQGASSSTISRFVYSAIMEAEFTADVAVAYMSVLSLMKVNITLLLRGAKRRLAPCIAQDTHALTSLIRLMNVLLVNNDQTASTRKRVMFILRFISYVLEKRMDEEINAQRIHANETLQELWFSCARAMVTCIGSGIEAETVVFAIIECLSQLIAQKEEMFKMAQDYLVATLPEVMIEKYLFRDMPTLVEKRIMHVVIALDALSKAASDKRSYETLMQAITNCADDVKSGSRAERLIGVFVLRCLTRCSEQVVDVALDKMTSFIATNKQRKKAFLPLVRAAVLGMDTGKKDVCVAWMMRVFGDTTQAQCQSVVTTDALETKWPKAKL